MKGSLRTRLIAGAVVWMTVVLLAVIAAVVRLTRNHPEIALRHATHFVMVIAAIAFLGGGLLLVRKALAPFRTLRTGLSSVRDGRSARVEGEYPSEVQPLVNDLNALLDDRERAVARALTTAGDLAHGLKTPLAILAQEAEQAGAAGHRELAATLRQQVERMQRQIDYHLARARATASSGAAPGVRCAVLPSVKGLVRTMRRLHAERELVIDTDVAPSHEIRGRREDLEEMLGNLLDNACKWARSRVAISSSLDDARVLISVDDDGSGLEPSMREQVLQRGVRADQQVGTSMDQQVGISTDQQVGTSTDQQVGISTDQQVGTSTDQQVGISTDQQVGTSTDRRRGGSGLGLAIVSDLAELHGGSVTLETSPLGGTRARLALPRF